MASIVVVIALVLGFFYGAKNPRRLLLAAIFLSPWAGLEVDIGLRVTAYLICIVPLFFLFLMRISLSSGNPGLLRLHNTFLLIIAFAIIWSVAQIPFLPDADVSGGLLRSPQFRAIVQIIMFLVMISPVFLVPWLVRDQADIIQFGRIYILSVVVLALIGWVQIALWVATESNPLPIGYVNSLLGGVDFTRSGQFYYEDLLIMRMNSFGGEPKDLGAGLAVGLLILQAGLCCDKRRQFMIWGFLFATLLTTLSSMSITTWFGATVLQLTYRYKYNFTSRRKTMTYSRNFLLSVLAASLILPSFYILFSDSVIFNILEIRTVGRLTGEGGQALDGTSNFGLGFLEDFNDTVVAFLVDQPWWLPFGVGLGNVHLYADPYMPPVIRSFAGGTSFVAKSAALRWISELGLVSFIILISWWLTLQRIARNRWLILPASIRPDMGVMGIGFLVFWVIAGYMTAQFFLLAGVMVVSSRLSQHSIGA